MAETVVALVTGPSASGKSTLQDALIKKGWVRPINYTTRPPRNDKELDEYVFIDQDAFAKKARNGDFAEWTQYRRQLYAMTKYLDYSKDNVIVVDPIGKGAFEAFLIKSKVKFFRIWVECPDYVRESRLNERRSNVIEFNERMGDSAWFNKVNNVYDVTVDGTWPAEEAANFVIKYANSIRN